MINIVFSEPVIIQLISFFMEYKESPYPGYRLKRKYTQLISDHPYNSGKLFRDPNGRISGSLLSALYLGCGPHFYDACTACKRNERYPGRVTSTSFGETFDPHAEYQRMTQ